MHFQCFNQKFAFLAIDSHSINFKFGTQIKNILPQNLPRKITWFFVWLSFSKTNTSRKYARDWFLKPLCFGITQVLKQFFFLHIIFGHEFKVLRIKFIQIYPFSRYKLLWSTAWLPLPWQPLARRPWKCIKSICIDQNCLPFP